MLYVLYVKTDHIDWHAETLEYLSGYSSPSRGRWALYALLKQEAPRLRTLLTQTEVTFLTVSAAKLWCIMSNRNIPLPPERKQTNSIDDEPLPTDISGIDIHAKLRALHLDEGTLQLDS